MIKVFLQGELRGEWLELPATEEELKEASERVGSDEDIFISDVESEFVQYVDELADIRELNELAERIENVLNHYDEAVVKAVLAECYTLIKALVVLEYGDFTVLHDVHDVFDLGVAYVQEGLLGDISEEAARYLDYESLGADLTNEGWSIYSDLGIAVCIL